MSARAWRLDAAAHAAQWDSGEGAKRFGGRWNSRGRACVYASLDPATAILEVAVHKGFAVLDAVPHVLTCFEFDETALHRVRAKAIPERAWLAPGIVTPGQQRFGTALIAAHFFAALPSVVVPQAENLIFDPVRAAGRYRRVSQEPFTLDPRLRG